MSKYYQAWIDQKKPSYRALAKQFNVNESVVRRSINIVKKRNESRDIAETSVVHGMNELGFHGQPHSGWIKSQEPDKHGNTYSYYFLNKEEEKTAEERTEAIADLFKEKPPILFKPPQIKVTPRLRKAFISINDLHSGALA